jgi:hypothetical protein
MKNENDGANLRMEVSDCDVFVEFCIILHKSLEFLLPKAGQEGNVLRVELQVVDHQPRTSRPQHQIALVFIGIADIHATKA